jgi:LysR family glycine cleavage system transcriptional activator
MRRLPPLNQIRAFEAAARLGSFKDAAAELCVTDSAISQHIRALEARIGTPLFARNYRGVELTAEAQRYIGDLSQALDLIAEATEKLTRTTLEGVLRVSAAPSFGTRWLIPRLKRFTANYPQIKIEPLITSELSDVTADGTDIALRHGDGNWSGVAVDHLRDEELVPVCAPELLDGRAELSVEEMLGLPLLTAKARAGEWSLWLRAQGSDRPDTDSLATYDSIGLAIDAAIAGIGIVLADRLLVAEDIRQGRLCMPVTSTCPGPSAFYLVYAKSRATDPKTTAFRDWLHTELTQTAA